MSKDPFAPQNSSDKTAPQTGEGFVYDGESLVLDGKAFDDDANNREFPILPEGTYPAVVSDMEIKNSKSGNLMAVLTYRIDKNNRVWDYIVLNQKWKVAQLLKALAIAPDEKGQYALRSSDVIGCVLLVTIKHETYEGKKRMSVKGIAPASQDDELALMEAGL